jgi:hypothetical protein
MVNRLCVNTPAAGDHPARSAWLLAMRSVTPIGLTDHRSACHPSGRYR